MYNPPKASRRGKLPEYRKKYDKFRGVDFSSDITKVDSTRSPYAPNLISDEGGNPVKRMGYEDVSKIKKTFTGTGTQTTFALEQNVGSVTATVDGVEKAVSLISDNKYTIYGITAIGTGAAYEWYNINKQSLGRFRPVITMKTNQFTGNGTNKVFYLDTTNIDNVNSVTVSGVLWSKFLYFVSKSTGILTFYTAPSSGSPIVVEFTKPQIETAPAGAAYLRASVYGPNPATDPGDLNTLTILKGIHTIPELSDFTVYKNLSYTGSPSNKVWERAYNGKTYLYINAFMQNGVYAEWGCSSVAWESYRYIYVKGFLDETSQGVSTFSFYIGNTFLIATSTTLWPFGSYKYIPIPAGATGNLRIVVDATPTGSAGFYIENVILTGGTAKTGNLFISANVTPDKYIEESNGVLGSSSSWNISEYIDITPANTNVVFSPAPASGKKIEIIYQQFTATIHSITPFKDGIVVHSGTSLYYKTLSSITLIKVNIKDAKSSAFIFNNKLYILTGAEYLVYDGTVCSAVTSTFVPTTAINNEPYQGFNMLHNMAKNEFIGNGVQKVFTLNTTPDTGSTITVEVDRVILTTGYSINGAVIAFTTAPSDKLGIPNIVITFQKTMSNKVSKCTFATVYANRVFFSGNPDYPSSDFASGVNDPAYVADNDYTGIGTNGVGDSTSPIMGYLHMGEDLAIVKFKGIYLRTIMSTDAGTIFPVKQGVMDIGAISKSMALFVDDPLFISRKGVYGIGSNAVNCERSIQKRSSFVDPILTKESNLQNAFTCVWNDYFLLFAGANVYVADCRQKSYTNNSTGTFEYEWYYWTLTPNLIDKGSASTFADIATTYPNAEDGWSVIVGNVTYRYNGYDWIRITGRPVCAASANKTLYFGTEDGKIMQFYSDPTINTYYNDNGHPIVAEWATPLEDDGTITRFKSLTKRGNTVHLKTYNKSSVKILVRTEKDLGKEINTSYRLMNSSSEIIQCANKSSFPVVGEAEKYYYAIDTKIVYKWQGSGSYNIVNMDLYPSLSSFPKTGASGKYYYAIDTKLLYKWEGSNVGMFNFVDMDFENFTFNTSGQYIIPLNSKVKNYKYIQIICKNSELNQGFGIYQIEKQFTIGDYIK